MNLRRFCTLLGLAIFAFASTAEARVHRVFPGDSIQAAIDGASAGDSIIVEPGVYQETGNADFGLRISTDNLRLIGKTRRGEKVRLIHYDTQHTGVYAAPAACGPEVGVGGCPDELQGFQIRGFTVEDFPRNGIQTRFVNNFRIVRNESANNGNENGNGIYPTISTNGLVAHNLSYGSLDTAMWVAASSHVRVIGNEVRDSVIGLEISVSNDVRVTHNEIHNNTVGVGLFHPNAAGNAQLPVMEDWVIKGNRVYNNNLQNDAPPGSFQEGLPSGVGILLLGVSGHTIQRNTVEDNDFSGIAVLGWCTATLPVPGRNCFANAPEADPSVNDNLVVQNRVNGNGSSPPTDPPFNAVSFLAADITYYTLPGLSPPGELDEMSSGNCFKNNRPVGHSAVSSEPDGLLPTDGC